MICRKATWVKTQSKFHTFQRATSWNMKKLQASFSATLTWHLSVTINSRNVVKLINNDKSQARVLSLLRATWDVLGTLLLCAAFPSASTEGASLVLSGPLETTLKPFSQRRGNVWSVDLDRQGQQCLVVTCGAMWGWQLWELGLMEWPFPCAAAALAPSRLPSLGIPCSMGTVCREQFAHMGSSGQRNLGKTSVLLGMDLNLDLISILASSGTTVPWSESSRLVPCVEQLSVLRQWISATVEVAKLEKNGWDETRTPRLNRDIQSYPYHHWVFFNYYFSLWIFHSKMK